MSPGTTARAARAAWGVAAALVLAAGAAAIDASAAPAKRRRPRRRHPPTPAVVQVETPLGLQGLASAGANVVIPFTLVDPRRAPTDVEVEYGIDWDGDGTIADDEYRPATEDRLDPRNTRGNRKPQFFDTGTDPRGAANAIVWQSAADVGTGIYRSIVYEVTDQGRRIPDPAHPGDDLVDVGLGGLRVRLRAVLTWRRRRIVGEWSFTDPFELENDSRPVATIDQVAASEDVPGGVEVRWTAYDADSEDANGNGTFDPGEDRNGDGLFEQEQVGVAFDRHAVAPGEDVASMSASELEALTWLPCTRAVGFGDTDSFREPPETAVYGAPSGRSWTFVWDAAADVGADAGPFVLRARAVDQQKQVGEFAWSLQPFMRGQ